MLQRRAAAAVLCGVRRGDCASRTAAAANAEGALGGEVCRLLAAPCGTKCRAIIDDEASRCCSALCSVRTWWQTLVLVSQTTSWLEARSAVIAHPQTQQAHRLLCQCAGAWVTSGCSEARAHEQMQRRAVAIATVAGRQVLPSC